MFVNPAEKFLPSLSVSSKSFHDIGRKKCLQSILFCFDFTGEMIARRLDEAMAKYNASNQQGALRDNSLA